MSRITLLCRQWQALAKPGCWYGLLLVLLLSTSCTRRESFPQESSEPLEAEAERYEGQLLAQVIRDSITYIVPKQALQQPLTREFGDGTVVEKVMIRKVQEDKTDTAAYYLVGLGMRNGNFRSMALELDVTADNGLYLSSKSEKHICEASSGCDFCYFTYVGNNVTGCECATRVPGYNCEHTMSPTNQVLKGIKLSNSK
jgi:hypothetical protein